MIVSKFCFFVTIIGMLNILPVGSFEAYFKFSIQIHFSNANCLIYQSRVSHEQAPFLSQTFINKYIHRHRKYATFFDHGQKSGSVHQEFFFIIFFKYYCAG